MQNKTTDGNRNNGQHLTQTASPKAANSDNVAFQDDNPEFDPSDYVPGSVNWDDDVEDHSPQYGTEGNPNTIRNFEDGGYFRVHNQLFGKRGGLGAQLKPAGFAVYCALARYADNTTQRAFPSYDTLAQVTGLSKNKVIEVISELEAWGLILCQTRRKGRRHYPNLYTLLDVSHWRREATFRNAKGQVVTKRLADDDDEEELFEVSPPRFNLIEKSSSSQARVTVTPPGLHGELPGLPDSIPSLPGEPGGMPGIVGVVRHENSGSVRRGHEQDIVNKTNLYQDLDSKTTLKQDSTNEQMSVCNPSPSLRDSALLDLLSRVAPDFQGVNQAVSRLSPERFDTIGALTLYYLANPKKYKTLTNPAGYFRYIMGDQSKNENDIPNLPSGVGHYRGDWSKYLDLYQRANSEENTYETNRRLCCLIRRYGLTYSRCAEILDASPCNNRDNEDDYEEDYAEDEWEEPPF